MSADIKKDFSFFCQLFSEFLIFISENPRNPRLKGFSDKL